MTTFEEEKKIIYDQNDIGYQTIYRQKSNNKFTGNNVKHGEFYLIVQNRQIFIDVR